jgi:3'-5' exoribonuclease
MILSHHGQLEFGSPKLPQFPEALLLHYLDDMDSKMECMRALIANDRQVEGCFTAYSPTLERPALKTDRYLNGAVTTERVKAAAQPNGAAVRTPSVAAPPVPTASPAPPVAQPALAAHPLFAAKPDSPFADKLKEALLPAGSKQES